jgi:hypothetical protein
MRIPSIVDRVSPIMMTKGSSDGYGGGKWEIVKEFNGRSHREGGIDIVVDGGLVRHINAPNDKPDEIAKNGRVWRSIGAGAYGVGEGLLDTITFGATDQLTDAGYKALQKVGGASEDEMREQNSIRGYATTAGAITGGILTGGATTGSAIQQGAKGIGAGVSQGSPDSKAAQAIGTYLPLAGNLAGMAMGNAGYGAGIKGATDAAKTATAAGDAAKAAQMTSKAAALTKMSNIATKAGNMSPYLNMASAAISQPKTPIEGMNIAAGQVNTMMMQPRNPVMQAKKETSMAGKKPGQTGYADMDGFAATPTIGSQGEYEGPIQFRMPPIHQAESAQYLNRYGINV